MPISFNEIPTTIPGAVRLRRVRQYPRGAGAVFDAVSEPGDRAAPVPPATVGGACFPPESPARPRRRRTSAPDRCWAHIFGAAAAEQTIFTETWAVALDDEAAGVKSTGTITVGGVVAAGTIYLYIAGRRLTIGVSAGDYLGPRWPPRFRRRSPPTRTCPSQRAVDGVDDTQVNLSAQHKGGFTGDDIDIRHSYYDGEGLPTGLTLTIVAMANGAANPDITDVWPAIGDEHYNVITMPYTDAANLTALENRAGPIAGGRCA